MNQAQTWVMTEQVLLTLIFELLDAHADTVEFDPGDELRWEAHVDYLRALQRKAKEILARRPPAPQSIEFR